MVLDLHMPLPSTVLAFESTNSLYACPAGTKGSDESFFTNILEPLLYMSFNAQSSLAPTASVNTAISINSVASSK